MSEGARYDTRRRALGLSVSELAQLHGCAERTINRRVNDQQPVQPDDWDDLEDLEERMEALVDAVVRLATEKTISGPVPLVRYRSQAALDTGPHACDLPLGAHAMMIAWTDDQLAAQGIETKIIWAAE